MTDEERRELGAGDSPVEDELEQGFDSIVTSGAERLHRTALDVLVTGLFGGSRSGSA